MKIWNIDENKFTLKTTYSDHNYAITALDATAEHIISGDAKATIIIHEVSDGNITKVKQSDQHQDVQVIRISSDGKTCAVGFNFGIIYLYTISTATCSGKLRGHDGDIQSFLWLHNKLISTAKDRTIKLWSIADSKCRQTLKLPKASGYKSKRLRLKLDYSFMLRL